MADNGDFYAQLARGNVFVASTAAAGIALIVPATTGNHPTLWNPAGSGFNLDIVAVELTYVSGNNAPTALEWAITSPAGSAIATGGPIATFTNVAPVNALAGAAADAVAKWAPAVNTYTAAPVFYRSAGISLFTGVAATAVAPFPLIARYNGDFGIAPGAALSLCSQAATTTALFQVSVTYIKVAI